MSIINTYLVGVPDGSVSFNGGSALRSTSSLATHASVSRLKSRSGDGFFPDNTGAIVNNEPVVRGSELQVKVIHPSTIISWLKNHHSCPDPAEAKTFGSGVSMIQPSIRVISAGSSCQG